MKTIILLPVKNEAWILRTSLKNFSSFADAIIVADQHSTDGSLDIYKEFPKVKVIENNVEGHANAVRWLLLDEARKIEGTNLIFCIDADEIISPKTAFELQKSAEVLAKNHPEKTYGFSFRWIQLWKSISFHRVDTVWKDNRKAAAFIDDGRADYIREITLNDHTSRIPEVDKIIDLPDPLLHFQYVVWEQADIKQAWYKCNELIAGRKAKAINHQYSVSLDGAHVITEPSEKEWFTDMSYEYEERPIESDWRYKEILSWFEKYGVEYFEPLQIWHIDLLRALFMKKTGRSPNFKAYPKYVIWLNALKNRVRNHLQKFGLLRK